MNNPKLTLVSSSDTSQTFEFVTQLDRPLTQDEKDELGIEMADAVKRREQAEDEIKAAKNKWKPQIENSNVILADSARTLRSGKIKDDITCHKIIYLESGMVEFMRTDTGEVFHRRPIKEDERQLRLEVD